MSDSAFRPKTVLRGRIEDLHDGKSYVSFALEGCTVELPERGAASPVEEGQVVTLVVRRKFWPSTEHVALAFVEQGEGKSRSVGRGIHLLGLCFGLPLIVAVIAIKAVHLATGNKSSDDSIFWPAMVVGGVFVAYSAFRVIEISRAVKRLREHVQASPAQMKTGVS